MSESMRGMRLGSQSLESDRGVVFEPRVAAEFVCSNNHKISLFFSQEAVLPEIWDCTSCSMPAVRLVNGAPMQVTAIVADEKRSHYDMVLERRTRAELEELLDEKLAQIRERRRAGSADV